jgi:Flp pilus assembly pilin Flp
MLSLVKDFWKDESGLGTVEIIVILAVLIAIALIFKDAITKWVKDALDVLFPPKDIVNNQGGNV